MGSQQFGYKPGDPIKVGDLNNLMGFSRNISTDNGVVSRDGAYFQSRPTNEQSMADLTNADFNIEQYPVRSHSVIYGVKVGNVMRWYHTRQTNSQAFYTLGNASVETVGTQKLDKWGTPLYNDATGQPIIGDFGNKYMVAVQPMVPGMKYVLRCDPHDIDDANRLENGDLCYWGSWYGLKRATDKNPEFSVVRYEYNYAPLSPARTHDPLLDLNTRAMFWNGIFVAAENKRPDYNLNLSQFTNGPVDVSVLVFVQTDLNDGSINSEDVLSDYYYTGLGFPVSPALSYMPATSGNTDTAFYSGYRYYLTPYAYSITDCYENGAGYVYSGATGKIYAGVVPRLNAPEFRVADIINADEFTYQFEWQRALENAAAYPYPAYTSKTVPYWNNGNTLDAHQVKMPTEYDENTIDAGYAECIYHPVEETVTKKELENLGKVVLPITKPLRSDVKPRPNRVPGFTSNSRVPASYYSAKSMGLIEPTNSTPTYQIAYYHAESDDDNLFSEYLNQAISFLRTYDPNNAEHKIMLAGVLEFIKSQSFVLDSIGYFESVDDLAGNPTRLLAVMQELSEKAATYKGAFSYVKVPFVLEVTLGREYKREIGSNYSSSKCKYYITRGYLNKFPGIMLVGEGFINNVFKEWDVQVIDDDSSYVTLLINGVYIANSGTLVPIAISEVSDSGTYIPFFMQKVEVETVTVDDTNYKAAQYKAFTDKSPNSYTGTKSTAGWIGYRYYSDNPDISDTIDEESFTLPLVGSVGKLKLKGVDKTYLTFEDDVKVEIKRYIPIAYFDEFENIYGTFTVSEVSSTKIGEGKDAPIMATARIKFQPVRKNKVYNDLYSFPFIPYTDVDSYTAVSPPHSPVRITTKTFKAHRSDWIPAICDKLDQNEVLIPGMLVGYTKSETPLYECQFGAQTLLGNFFYATVTPPDSYSTVTDGTPNFVIDEIKYAMPNVTEVGSGIITDDDVWVTDIRELDEDERLPKVNISGNEYYYGVKLGSNGYPDIREAFGGFRDCDNVGNMTIFTRTTPYNVSFPCTGRLDFIPFGYAVPSRTPSCYYKASEDECAVNFVSNRYIMTRIDDAGIENQLFLSGACYVPCSSLTSLGNGDS